MAIIFHSEKYQKIRIDSNIIVGITGYDYKEFIKSLSGDNIYYIENEIVNKNKTVGDIVNSKIDLLDDYLKCLGLEKDFLNKKIDNLSHSEIKLAGYLKMLLSEANIIIIDEPFMDLDYDTKKRIISLFNKLIKNKTIIIASTSTDTIYSLCKKVLLLGKNKFLYDDVNSLANKSVLKRFHLVMPEIAQFVRLANDKKAKLSLTNDIRDLIKDVYKNVSK